MGRCGERVVSRLPRSEKAAQHHEEAHRIVAIHDCRCLRPIQATIDGSDPADDRSSEDPALSIDARRGFFDHGKSSCSSYPQDHDRSIGN
jgi:hypothetical protein